MDIAGVSITIAENLSSEAEFLSEQIITQR